MKLYWKDYSIEFINTKVLILWKGEWVNTTVPVRVDGWVRSLNRQSIYSFGWAGEALTVYVQLGYQPSIRH